MNRFLSGAGVLINITSPTALGQRRSKKRTKFGLNQSKKLKKMVINLAVVFRINKPKSGLGEEKRGYIYPQEQNSHVAQYTLYDADVEKN